MKTVSKIMPVKKCRVVHIITTLELGGAQKYALYVAGHLPSETYESVLISGSEGILQPDARRLLADQWICVPALCRAIHPLRDLVAGWLLVSLLRRLKPDIVHTHSSKAGILGRGAAHLAGVPVIMHTIHGWSFTPETPPASRWFIIQIERVAARFTTVLIAVSQSDIVKGLRYGIGQPAQYQLVRLGVQENEDMLDGEPSYRAGQTFPAILAVACLKPQKNPRDMVRAAALVCRLLPRVTWGIAGDGPLRPQVEAMIRENHLEGSVTLLGWRRDIYRLLQQARVVVLTSRWEGLPLAILEAMALAKPVVAYAVDGVGEAVQDGVTGYLVAPGDVAQLARRVRELLDNPAVAQTMGRAGQAALQERGYTSRKMMARLQKVYEQSYCNVTR